MPQTPAFAYIRQGISPFFRLPLVDVQAAAPYAGLDARRGRRALRHGDDVPPGRAVRALRGAPRERARPGVSPDPQGRRVRRAEGGRRRQRRDSALLPCPRARRHRERDRLDRRGRRRAVRGRRRPLDRAAGHARGREEARSARRRARRRPPRHERRRRLGRRLPPRDPAPARHRGRSRRARPAPPDRNPRALGVSRRKARSPRATAPRSTIRDAVAARGHRASPRASPSAVGDRPVYITFDVDGVDPAFAPGTGHPRPGGNHRARGHRAASRARRAAPRRHGRRRGLPLARPRRRDVSPRGTLALRGHGPPGRGVAER